MNAERLSSMVWFLVGAASIYGAIDLGIGSMAEPGSGFMAFTGGCFISLMALLIFVQSYKADPTLQTRVSALWQGVNWSRSLAITLLTLIFILSFEKIGFFVSGFLLLVTIMRWLEGVRWTTSLIVPLVAVASTYLLFHTVLQISLPSGIFGF
jgi:putative tricarboxylic transport membrane protein